MVHDVLKQCLTFFSTAAGGLPTVILKRHNGLQSAAKFVKML